MSRSPRSDARGRSTRGRSPGPITVMASLLLFMLTACGDVTQGPVADGNLDEALPTEERPAGDGATPDGGADDRTVEPARPLSAGRPDPAYVVTVPLDADDTMDLIAERTGGRVLVWRAGEFALVGLEDESSPEDGAALRVAPSGDAEENVEAFLAGGAIARMNGSSYVWARGSSETWAGGSSYVWARGDGDSQLWSDGEYAWMPENTPIWQQIGLREGQALAERLGQGVKVAVLDTGVDLEHPALREALAPEDEWWDFYDDDAVPGEVGELGNGGMGHGTNVAGIVRQIAPRATILPIRVLGPDGGGRISDLAAAIDWAVQQGADVINLSLGSEGTSASVDAAITSATNRGVLVVASTGNSGDDAVAYPAASAAARKGGWQRLSVTSVNVEDDKSEFATYGESVELAAPGEEVFGPAPGERLAAWSGTSMAAPMASGAIALALGEDLKVPRVDLADELRHRAYHDIYNNRNREYQHLLGRGRLDLVEYLRNVVEP